ncbi:MAG: hypothetical protein LRZ88_06430 [Candidatus Cloacimonetes bacterium]|nr:hypothetical protein [Candidatus Cloacimonadota bacterium]
MRDNKHLLDRQINLMERAIEALYYAHINYYRSKPKFDNSRTGIDLRKKSPDFSRIGKFIRESKERKGGYIDAIIHVMKGYLWSDYYIRDNEVDRYGSKDLTLAYGKLNDHIDKISNLQDTFTATSFENPAIYPVFLDIKKITSTPGREARRQSFDSVVKYAKEYGQDGGVIINVDDGGDVKADIYFASPPPRSSLTTANVGTFDPSNPDIRYRVEDTDLDARLKRAHEMLKKYKANADPKEASEKIATEIAKAKNLDPSQADEKIGRMIRAAYREGEGKAKESLAAFGIAETEAFIQTNKPDGTDKQDLTFHMEDALAYAADMGLSEADVKNLGADRFTYYLKGLNMYAYGNELTQQLNEKYAEKQALAVKGITDEALDQEISNLISLVADARLKYENMKGQRGGYCSTHGGKRATGSKT